MGRSREVLLTWPLVRDLSEPSVCDNEAIQTDAQNSANVRLYTASLLSAAEEQEARQHV